MRLRLIEFIIKLYRLYFSECGMLYLDKGKINLKAILRAFLKKMFVEGLLFGEYVI